MLSLMVNLRLLEMKNMTGLSRRKVHQHSIAAILAFCLMGCGGTGDGLGGVTGTITLNGDPLVGVIVEFSPTDSSGSMAMGLTDSSGHYELMFSMSQTGASLGSNTVKISTADAGLPDGSGKTIKELVPAEYNSKSSLVATVEAGANVIDFELKSSDDSEVVQPKLEL